MHVSDCTFSNFSLIQSPDQRCYFQEPFSYEEESLEDGDGLSSDGDVDAGGGSPHLLVMNNGCAQIMMCLSRSSCSMTDTSLCNIEMKSESMVYMDRPDVSDYYFSKNTADDGSRSGVECQLSTGHLVENVLDTTNQQQQQQHQNAVGGGTPSSTSMASNTVVSPSTTCIEDTVGGTQIFEILCIDSGGCWG